jgi:hypothetical protein
VHVYLPDANQGGAFTKGEAMKTLTLTIAAAVAGMCLYGATLTMQAQEVPSRPFSIGETITLHYEHHVSCLVGEVRGDFIRCDEKRRDDFRFNQPKTERWYNVSTVTQISKAVTQ